MNTLSLNIPIFARFSFSINTRALLKLLLSFTACSILFLLGFYLFQLGDLVRDNYLIKNYQLEINGFSEGGVGALAQSKNPLSLENIEEQIKNLGFVQVQEIKYIPIPAHYLARKTQ